MQVRRWSFGGFGTIFSLIVVYFIYLYSKSQGWHVLAFISKWYLIIIGGLILLSLGIVLIILLFSLVMFLVALYKIKQFGRKQNRQKKDYIEAEYEIKE